MSHKTNKSLAKLISQSCGELYLAICLSRGYGAIWRQPEHLWTSDKPQKQATAKAARQLSVLIPTWIVSQHVQLSFNGESVSWCCVRGSQLFSNSVTYDDRLADWFTHKLYNTYVTFYAWTNRLTHCSTFNLPIQLLLCVNIIVNKRLTTSIVKY